MSDRRSKLGAILLTLFLGLICLVFPLPAAISAARPLLILLFLAYWALHCPSRVGVGVAWMMGILTDFLYGVILGPYALGFAVAIYLVIRWHSRFVMFPMFQQALFIGMLVAGVQLEVIAIGVLSKHLEIPWGVLLSIPTSMLCWPLVVMMLGATRQGFAQE